MARSTSGASQRTTCHFTALLEQEDNDPRGLHIDTLVDRMRGYDDNRYSQNILPF